MMISTIEYQHLRDVQRGKIKPPRALTIEEKLNINEYRRAPKIKVFQINQVGLGNTLFLEFGKLGDFEDLCISGLETANIGDKYTIEIIAMPPGEFQNLGEFECFE